MRFAHNFLREKEKIIGTQSNTSTGHMIDGGSHFGFPKTYTQNVYVNLTHFLEDSS
jgi:hypothetical protein